MIRKPTEELTQALKRASSVEEYILQEEAYLIDISLSEYLEKLRNEKQLSKANVIRNSQLHDIYGYQILSGKKKPSRDKLLALAFGLHLNSTETQQLLKFAGYAQLYPKDKRDSIIYWSIEHELSILQTNELLYTSSFDTL